MAVQRLTQKNVAGNVRPARDDLLIAGETPRFDGVKLRIVRTRVAQDGFAERVVNDIACLPGNFWHSWTLLAPEKVEELRAALTAAKTALARVAVGKDENGHYRLIDCRLDGHRSVLKMRYLGDVAEHDAPEFEAAWSMVASLFPVPDSP